VTEREVKLAFDSPAAARAAVVAMGAAPLRARRLQDDVLYDTSSGALRASRSVLRLRRDGETAAVTLKGPAEASMMKVRDEHETPVGDAAILSRVFDALGLDAWFRYQKYREEFRAPGVTIAVDETPVGTFVEIEGTEDGILAATAALGRTPQDFILDSYVALFASRAEAYGLTTRDMMFATP
jgi:adenylate cyclase class 2